MAQTVEKQSFCNLCADLTVDLDSLVLENEENLQEDRFRKKNEMNNLLLKLFTKGKFNSNYLNEVAKINNYKASIDRKNNFKIPFIIG